MYSLIHCEEWQVHEYFIIEKESLWKVFQQYKFLLRQSKYIYIIWHILSKFFPIIYTQNILVSINCTFLKDFSAPTLFFTFYCKKRHLKPSSRWVFIGHKINPNVSGMTSENNRSVWALTAFVNHTGVGSIWNNNSKQSMLFILVFLKEFNIR